VRIDAGIRQQLDAARAFAPLHVPMMSAQEEEQIAWRSWQVVT